MGWSGETYSASAVKVNIHPFYTTVTKQALMLSPCDSAA